MSSKWTTDAVEKLSKEELDELEQVIQQYASILTWDNINILFRVFSQHMEKKGALGCGTAAMVFVKKSAPQQPLYLVKDVQEQRAWGLEHPLGVLDILDLHEQSAEHIEGWMTYHVLRVLLDAPEFDLKTYAHGASDALKAPASLDELPCGPEHVTEEYMLGTMATPEQSYEDNDKVLTAILRQLGIRSNEQLRSFSETRLLYTVGDQLTVDRVRGLQRFRCQDLNSADRLDYIIPVWGWLHFQMAVARSLHKQYLGTTSGFAQVVSNPFIMMPLTKGLL
ncbi:hypothetical protein OH77DRAFT_1493969 [Trametes cingulata]|nr:hypothetical protein OH77DRAFT_1493969 [Trametes cingulata]